MTNAQRLAVRLSEIRQRLNEIAGLAGDGVTDEVRAESDRLAGEYRTAETQHRAALIAESAEADAAADDFNHGGGDGEAAEVRALRGRVRIGEYVSAAVEERMADGAESELNAALGMRGNAFPLSLLAPAPVEARATTDTDSQTNQSGRWLDRLFAGTAAERIGITMGKRCAGRRVVPRDDRGRECGAAWPKRGGGGCGMDRRRDGIETDPERGAGRFH